MSIETISHTTFKELASGGSVRSAVAVGNNDRWSLLIQHGHIEKFIRATNSGEVRKWANLNSLTNYLVKLGILEFQTDARNFDPTKRSYHRPDRSEALKSAHAAAAHEKWRAERVQATLSDDRDALSQEDAFDEIDKRMAEKYGARG